MQVETQKERASSLLRSFWNIHAIPDSPASNGLGMPSGPPEVFGSEAGAEKGETVRGRPSYTHLDLQDAPFCPHITISQHHNQKNSLTSK